MGRLFSEQELADTLIGNIQSGVSEREALVDEDGAHCRHAAECCEGVGDRARFEDFSGAPFIDVEVGESSFCLDSGEANDPVRSLPACIKKGELVCVATDNPIPIMEVEPLAMCAIQSGRADFSASLDSSD